MTEPGPTEYQFGGVEGDGVDSKANVGPILGEFTLPAGKCVSSNGFTRTSTGDA